MSLSHRHYKKRFLSNKPFFSTQTARTIVLDLARKLKPRILPEPSRTPHADKFFTSQFVPPSVNSTLQTHFRFSRTQLLEKFQLEKISHPRTFTSPAFFTPAGTSAISHQLAPSRTISHHLAPSRTISHQLAPSRIISHHLAPSRINSHHLASTRTISHQLASTRTISHQSGSTRINSHQLALSRINPDQITYNTRFSLRVFANPTPLARSHSIHSRTCLKQMINTHNGDACATADSKIGPNRDQRAAIFTGPENGKFQTRLSIGTANLQYTRRKHINNRTGDIFTRIGTREMTISAEVNQPAPNRTSRWEPRFKLRM